MILLDLYLFHVSLYNLGRWGGDWSVTGLFSNYDYEELWFDIFCVVLHDSLIDFRISIKALPWILSPHCAILFMIIGSNIETPTPHRLSLVKASSNWFSPVASRHLAIEGFWVNLDWWHFIAVSIADFAHVSWKKLLTFAPITLASPGDWAAMILFKEWSSLNNLTFLACMNISLLLYVKPSIVKLLGWKLLRGVASEKMNVWLLIVFKARFSGDSSGGRSDRFLN